MAADSMLVRVLERPFAQFRASVTYRSQIGIGFCRSTVHQSNMTTEAGCCDIGPLTTLSRESKVIPARLAFVQKAPLVENVSSQYIFEPISRIRGFSGLPVNRAYS